MTGRRPQAGRRLPLPLRRLCRVRRTARHGTARHALGPKCQEWCCSPTHSASVDFFLFKILILRWRAEKIIQKLRLEGFIQNVGTYFKQLFDQFKNKLNHPEKSNELINFYVIYIFLYEVG